MLETGQQKIVDQLLLVALVESCRCLHLVDDSALNKHVKVVGFSKVLMRHVKMCFSMYLKATFSTALSQFLLIDPFIAEAAKSVMDIECMSHHFPVHSMEPILLDRGEVNTTLDWHVIFQ